MMPGVLTCCGKIPELVFGQWEPHAPSADCRGECRAHHQQFPCVHCAEAF